MPLKIGSRTYKNFASAVRAVKRKHPSWSEERCRKYVNSIQKNQEKGR